MTGTIVNTAAVILGSAVGLLIHKNLPGRITQTAFQGIGLFTLFIGVKMAMATSNLLIMVFSIVLGSIAGELIDIDRFIENFGNLLKARLKSKNERFTEGLVTSFMLFCMGSMTILGAFDEGFGRGSELLLAKSVLDGFSSIALAASMGIGVMFSAIPLLLYQGGLTLFAGWLEGMLSVAVINEIAAVGGLILIGMGFNILEIKKIKALNMLPALLIAAVLAYSEPYITDLWRTMF